MSNVKQGRTQERDWDESGKPKQSRNPDYCFAKKSWAFLPAERVIITDNLNYTNPNPIPSETLPPQETGIFTKRIGSTNYRVSVHFSKTSRETMNDKVLRLVKNEAVKP